MYSCTLSLTSALDWVGVSATTRTLYPRERPGTHCIGCLKLMLDGINNLYNIFDKEMHNVYFLKKKLHGVTFKTSEIVKF
jgi:hypothetical protein